MARIAIVDDSRLARTFTVSCLRKLEHDLVEVDPLSLFDVIKTLREGVPDLILMDYLMPNCPGISLARTLREDPIFQDCRVVVISAHRDEEAHELLKRFGVEEFLLKPFEPVALVDLVNRLVGGQADEEATGA